MTTKKKLLIFVTALLGAFASLSLVILHIAIAVTYSWVSILWVYPLVFVFSISVAWLNTILLLQDYLEYWSHRETKFRKRLYEY